MILLDLTKSRPMRRYTYRVAVREPGADDAEAAGGLADASRRWVHVLLPVVSTVPQLQDAKGTARMDYMESISDVHGAVAW